MANFLVGVLVELQNLIVFSLEEPSGHFYHQIRYPHVRRNKRRSLPMDDKIREGRDKITNEISELTHFSGENSDIQ